MDKDGQVRNGLDWWIVSRLHGLVRRDAMHATSPDVDGERVGGLNSTIRKERFHGDSLAAGIDIRRRCPIRQLPFRSNPLKANTLRT